MPTSSDQICRSLSLPVAAGKLSSIAEQHGTPVYVYSWDHIARQCALFRQHIRAKHTTFCYAVKANGNINLLRKIFGEGLGADVVSGGEFERAKIAGCLGEKIVFSGVGKTADEIRRAVCFGHLSFNVESTFELELINSVAKETGKIANVSLRVNPNIDAKTNPYIATGLYETKFGIAESDIGNALTKLPSLPHVKLVGLACHIGSQITELAPLEQAVTRMLSLATDMRAQGHNIELVNMGGGLGIDYGQGGTVSIEAYGDMLSKHFNKSDFALVLEPGRIIVGASGVLLTHVIGIKTGPQKRFVVVDAAMTELIRPCLYEAHHEITLVSSHGAKDSKSCNTPTDVVGPVCETSDFLALDRGNLPDLNAGDLLAIHSCGAYAASMGSNYNTRPRAPEVLVEGENLQIIRRREVVEDIWRNEVF